MPSGNKPAVAIVPFVRGTSFAGINASLDLRWTGVLGPAKSLWGAGMKLLNFEAAAIEGRIAQVIEQLRFQHKLFSLRLDDALTRGWALRLLAHGLRVIAHLEGHRSEIIQAHADRIVQISTEEL